MRFKIRRWPISATLLILLLTMGCGASGSQSEPPPDPPSEDICADKIEDLGCEELAALSSSAAIDIRSMEDVERFCRSTCVDHQGTLSIHSVEGLHNLEPFSQLRSLRSLSISRNPHLESLEGLELEELHWLRIENNPRLRTLKGLEGLEALDVLNIEANDMLEDLEGLENIRVLRSDINATHIERNPRLSSLRGLRSLQEAGSDLIFTFNGNLQSLEGLQKLERVTNFLVIGRNENLRSVSELESLHSLGGLMGNNNPLLPTCQLERIGQVVEDPSKVILEDNGTGSCE